MKNNEVSRMELISVTILMVFFEINTFESKIIYFLVLSINDELSQKPVGKPKELNLFNQNPFFYVMLLG